MKENYYESVVCSDFSTSGAPVTGGFAFDFSVPDFNQEVWLKRVQANCFVTGFGVSRVVPSVFMVDNVSLVAPNATFVGNEVKLSPNFISGALGAINISGNSFHPWEGEIKVLQTTPMRTNWRCLVILDTTGIAAGISFRGSVHFTWLVKGEQI